jgi:hypothetical protein
MHFRHKSSTQSRLAEFIELVVDEPEQNAALADAAVSDHDDLDLRKVLIHYE